MTADRLSSTPDAGWAAGRLSSWFLETVRGFKAKKPVRESDAGTWPRNCKRRAASRIERCDRRIDKIPSNDFPRYGWKGGA